MKHWHANLLLFLAAFIWGSTFVAQQMAMDHMGPLAINAVRFLIGTAFVVPFMIFEYQLEKRNEARGVIADIPPAPSYQKLIWRAIWVGAIPGASMALAAALQQAGLLYTNVANAGFLTSVNVALVPVWGFILFRQIPSLLLIAAVFVSMSGAYFLTGGLDLTTGINIGDIYVLGSAVFWALNYQLLAWARRKGPGGIAIACGQFLFVALSSFVVALIFESFSMATIIAALGPLLFAGVLSVGVAFTLQVWALKYTTATQASLILSLEAVFAAFAGWVMFDEGLNNAQWLGGALIMIAVIVSEASEPIQKWLARRRQPAI